MFHDILPRPRRKLRIGAVEVNAGELEVQHRLIFGIVLRRQQSLRFVLVRSLESRLRSSDFVFEIENSPGPAN
jgi:hypothetical protein